MDLTVGDGEPVAGVIDETISTVFPLHTSLDCGLDRGLSVCADYVSPFPFTGAIGSVRIRVGEQGEIDPSKMLAAAFTEQ